MRKGRRVMKCSVMACKKKSSNDEHVKFHRFPSNVPLCRKWLKNCADIELTLLPAGFLTKNRFVCSVHFHPDCYKPGTSMLKPGSLPTVDCAVAPLSDHDVQDYPLKDKPSKRSASVSETHTVNQSQVISHVNQEETSTHNVGSVILTLCIQY